MSVSRLGKDVRLPVSGGRRLPFALVVLAVATLNAAAAPAAMRGCRSSGHELPVERVRSALSQHPLRTLDGKPISAETLQGDVVVLNFWASWCAPCRRELQRLDALHAEISKQGGRVLAVSIDEDLANVQRFARRNRLTLPICHDGPDGLARALDLGHVPFTVVLDRGGAVAFTTDGSDRDALDALASRTRELLGGKPAAARSPEGGTP